MKNICHKIAILALITIPVSCCVEGCGNEDMVPQIILDTDIGSSYDDLIALAMLHEYEQQGKCHFLGVVVDRMGEDCASVADVINTFYGRPDLPLALVREGIPDPMVWIDYRDMADYRDSEGNRLFRTSGREMSELPDGYELYRKLLSSADDHSVSICSIGFLTALSQLLESGPDGYSDLSGVELVRRKVRCIYVMGGGFDGSIDLYGNFAQGLSFAKTFFRLWPDDVDVMMSPTEVGQMIDYTPQQVLEDFAPGHPFHEMFNHCSADDGQRMWDPLTVINAVEGDALFTISGRGRVTLGDDVSTSFEADAQGNYRYHIPGDDVWNEQMLSLMRRVVTSRSTRTALPSRRDVLRNGDLVFVMSDSSAMSSAISDATSDGEGPSFDHVGIIAVEDDGVKVIEARSDKGVAVTPWQEFLEEAPSYGDKVGICIRRVSSEVAGSKSFDPDAAVRKARSFVGLPYDWEYEHGNQAIYCSELVWLSYLDSEGKPLFEAVPMNFKGPDGNFPEFWTNLFEKLGKPIPQGCPGTNPNDLSRSDILVNMNQEFISLQLQ
ncbi:MAG: YiiX/YebB-like N1pC/P60 family cysteine hydrolase [Candidatus Cryptobacteroides sp.]